MNLALSENIRTLRKQKGLTQEQLAEVFGVTTGAVHKWETGMSYPEISLLMEMADYFDTSVDFLLGYDIKDNRLETALQRITSMMKKNDPALMSETEKVLKKYPNSFKAVLICAEAVLIIGTERHDKDIIRQALKLFDRSLVLIGQNNDPTVNASIIYGDMGRAYLALGEKEKGISILKEYNTAGIFNDDIGLYLAAFMKRPEEAQPYVSASLLTNFIGLFGSIAGQAFIHDYHKDYVKEKEILNWGLNLISGMNNTESGGYLNKLHAILLIMMAHAQLKAKENDKADASLRKAIIHVRSFDGSPDYGLSSVRFTEVPEEALVHDFLGATAQESVETVIGLLENDELLLRWKEISE